MPFGFSMEDIINQIAQQSIKAPQSTSSLSKAQLPAAEIDPSAAGSSNSNGSATDVLSQLEELFKPKGLEKFDPQGIGLKLLSSSLKGLAGTFGDDRQYIEPPAKRLELSDAAQVRRGPRFNLSSFLSSIGSSRL